jgi:membrane associated rhomboid family serine protease
MFLPIHDGKPRNHIELHYVTIGLIVANVVIFLFFQLDQRDGLAVSLMLIPSTLSGEALRPEAFGLVPEPVTVLTYAFLHADIWHLLGNMLFLWVFGDNVEDAVGHLKFLLFYGLCAIAGGLSHVAAMPDSSVPLIGASGAVAGVVAAYLILHPRVRVWVLFLGRIPLRLSAMLLLGGWIGVQLLFAFAGGDDGIAWWAHVGGLFAGAVLIVLFRRPGVPLFDRGLGAA